jgi:hypothetical protein
MVLCSLDLEAAMSKDFVMYKGAKYWLQSSGRYYSTRQRICGERLLHRRIWAERNGPIPKGYHIHHVDHDWRNNRINNLECVDGRKHRSDHQNKIVAALTKVQRIALLDAARVEAAKWHGSEEGLSWHSEHGRKSWENRKPVGAKCAKCGVPYWTYFPGRSSYCSRSCELAVAYRRHFTDVCNCEFCGQTFTRNKYRTQQVCCSLTCANKKRAADNRLLNPA